MGHVLVWSLVFLLLNTLLCEQAKGQTEVDGRDAPMAQTATYEAVLTLQPYWTEIFYGEAFTLRCEIQDEGNTRWTYEWTRDTINIPTTTNEYTITSPTTAHRGSYRCRGRTDSSLTEWSNVIELTLRDRPTAQLSIDTSIDQGSVTLSCSVSSSSGWKYYWYKDKGLYKPHNPQLYSDFPYINVPPGGTYKCRGGRGNPVYYSSDSNSVVMARAVLTLKSNWSEIFYSETVTLRCEITDGGDTEWVYLWSTSGPSIPNQQSGYLTFRVDFYNSRRYHCMGENKEDRDIKTRWSNSINLNVLSKPQAHLTSDTTSIQQGSSVTLTCSVSSSSGWKYYWYKDGTFYKLHTTQDFSDNPQISVSVGGRYWCRGGRGNPVYYTLDSNTLRISTIVSNRAVVTLDPNWSQIYSHENITLRCEIHGEHTEWEYEWRTSSHLVMYETESEIRIPKAYSGLTGNYSCRGKMKPSLVHSTNWSDNVTLTVSVDKPSSVLTVYPSWLSPGATVTLKCHVKHPSAGWRFYWYKAVPQRSHEPYRYELLPDSSEGTEQVFTIHGQNNTRGYVCRAGRGDPQIYSEYSQPKFAWHGDSDSSVSLRVSPNRGQHFTSEFFSLSCETNSSERRVRQFPNNRYSHCDIYSWRTDTSPCTVSKAMLNVAVFWCESGSGEMSNAVNISTHDEIILESPVYPVTEGQPLILGCRLWTDGILYESVNFYKNGKLIQNGTSEQLNITAVSKSDEGLYKCEKKEKQIRPKVWISSESWVSVKAASMDQRPPFNVLFVIGPICGILVIILLLLLCRYNSRFIRCPHTPKTSQSSAADHVINQTEAEHDLNLSPFHDDAFLYDSIKDNGDAGNGTFADVTYSSIKLKNIKGAKRQMPGEESTVYSDVKTKSAADENVVYAQVHAHGKGNAKGKKGKASPEAPDETVYSAVK